MAERSAPIAYMTQIFPNLTETAVYREVLCLRDLGFNISTFAVWKPDANKLSAESQGLMETTFYVFPLAWLRFVAAHLSWLLTRPALYMGTLFFVLTRPGESLRNRRRTFFHFLEAMYLAAEMQKRQIRHIHAHFSINAASIAMMIARMLDISFSFTVHNIFFTDRIILKEKLQAAKFIVSISEFSRDFLLQLYPQENLRDKFYIIHCGISPEHFSPPTHPEKRHPPLIFTVSQLAERKGMPFLVEACKILAERGCDFRCIIGGDGPQKPLLEQMIARYHLQDKVQLVGPVYQQQLTGYLNQTDLFVLPCITASNGDRDGVPAVLMEAMAMELPVVSTYVSGIPELISDGRDGLLINEKDPLALADAMQRLLEDQHLGQTLGKNGRQKVIKEFNLRQSAAQLAALFDKFVMN